MRARKLFMVSWAAVPLLTVANQACMKLLATQLGDAMPLASILSSPYSYSIVFCEVLSFVLWLRVLSEMEVGRAVPISSISYILVLMLGWIGFHESMHPYQLIGSALILGGAWLLGLPSSSSETVSP